MKIPHTFDNVLETIRNESINTRDLGNRFEKITKDFLKTDKLYANRFTKVWLWKQWPENDGADTGIDLVAEQTDDELCAIQCKCYADDGTLDMKTVATFLAKASSLKIKHKILVYTGDSLTNHAKKILTDSKTTIITPEHFRQSSIDWSTWPKITRTKSPKKLRPHQQSALSDVLTGLKSHDRGKMIMACGTGKTLTALHIAEKYAGCGSIVLYLVPSISLILQSMREWSENANIPHRYIAVCSDKSTGEDGTITELESPVSTDSETLKPFIKNSSNDAMAVIFSTYHSIEVVESTMNGKKLDLVFCDEAHRTTGTDGKSYYTRVHDDKNLHAKKRLYMTATPRVYSDAIKSLGKRKDKVIYSMDDKEKYGPEFHKLNFFDAVHKHKILADFKVKIAIVDADKVDKGFQQSVAGKDKAMPLDERTLLAAVWHGLRFPHDDESDPKLLQRVIAFCNRIDRSEMFAGVMKDPSNNDRSFEGVVNEINKLKKIKDTVEVRHIDGKDNALHRRKEMRWLDESNLDPGTCRIVSNAKCLSEGVDVPSLDGVIFLNPRKSVVDVVQSVGRVMRDAPGKDFGYVILPVAIPAGIKYNEAMNDNKTFKVVWEVLNALRSHDEEFAREINKLILDKRSENTGSVTPRISVSVIGDDDSNKEPISILFDKIKSKIIEKIGDINYYDKYGQEIGKAASTIESRLKNKIEHNATAKQEIQSLHTGLKMMINDAVTMNETIQVTAQHMVLSRVFDSLFQGEFTSHNPISIAFDHVIKKIKFKEELEELADFYKDVDEELKNIKSRGARQEFIKKIYGNFFESADKKGSKKHGIVYTPVEIIDFIINSVQYILKKELCTEFNDRSVKVMDPFTGTGTFLTRLLESGFIHENMYEKYKHDIIANEMILLAYYIATVNIETTYQSLRKGHKYVPFDGISYTDTLKLNARYREDERHRTESATLDDLFKSAQGRIKLQKSTHVHVIIGNPPYSSGQSNYNEDNPNLKYDILDERINSTYAEKTTVHAKNALYDSYVRSIRWASDRIGNSGIIALVTNASFLKSETAQGIRASLEKEFDYIWCYDLRGNQRTQGEISKKEGGKIFGSGSRAPVAIILLVKTTKNRECVIKYSDIGDYITRKEKLKIIKNTKSIQNIKNWQIIKPDKHNDWINQRDHKFSKYLPMGSPEAKSGVGNAIFKLYSSGIKTNRDVWIYNSSVFELSKNMNGHIEYCNNQNLNNPILDPTKAKWTGELSNRLKKDKPPFNKNKIRHTLYRPFFKQNLYYDRIYINSIHRIPDFFPENYSKNLVILIPYKYIGMSSVFITDITPDLEVVHHGQCFPLYVYENKNDKKTNVTDFILYEYREYYSDEKISKKDIFYYVYGMLHHSGYKQKFINNLLREFPHIPLAPNFWKFSNIGKKLTDLHLNFDTGNKYNLGEPKNKLENFHKLSFGKIKDGDKKRKDKTKLFMD
ncbi:MAG: restriction enzyme, partial [Cenarchaeum symbiont of Oopsacas minuta]|nr:restriction enzyme [Cenarchaeum symbiont of Oopsacas minuta]